MKHICILFLFSFLVSCSDQHEPGHWSYSGEEGPEHWAALSAEYELCSEGMVQSPIDIAGWVDEGLTPFELDYLDGGYEVINNGHTIQVNFQSGSTLMIEDQLFELKQFHFHTPSENTVDGASFPLEMHLVHASEQGDLAVLGVLFESGDQNQALERFWSDLPATEGDTAGILPKMSAEELLPVSSDYFRFDGSLTTPPCSEGVLWMVLSEPATISEDQVESIMTILGHSNNRPVQPLNGRLISKK